MLPKGFWANALGQIGAQVSHPNGSRPNSGSQIRTSGQQDAGVSLRCGVSQRIREHPVLGSPTFKLRNPIPCDVKQLGFTSDGRLNLISPLHPCR